MHHEQQQQPVQFSLKTNGQLKRPPGHRQFIPM